MTTISINLPDRIAEEASEAGLLSSENVEKLLRRELRAKQFDVLFSAMEKMDAADNLQSMTPEEIAQEMSEYKRAKKAD